jgi:cbb3-type cytochrome oxidase subunit 3
MLIEIIRAAIEVHEISGRFGIKESFLEILMGILGYAFPVKTLAIGLVFGVVWYVYSKRRKDINDAMEAAEEEKAAKESSPEQEEFIEPVQYKQQ